LTSWGTVSFSAVILLHYGPGIISTSNIKSRLCLKCDGTHAEIRFRRLTKRMSPFKLARASVQSTLDSWGVRISGSNAGYTKFRGSVKGTGYPLHSPISPSLPLPCVTVCHHVSNAVYHDYLLGGGGCIKWPVQRANNFITFMCWLSRNPWSLSLIEPLVHTEQAPFVYYFVLLLDCNNYIWRNIKAVTKLATAQWKLLWIKPWNWNHSTVTWFLDFVHCPIQRVQISFGCRTPLRRRKNVCRTISTILSLCMKLRKWTKISKD
jgi:hypothetical protein